MIGPIGLMHSDDTIHILVLVIRCLEALASMSFTYWKSPDCPDSQYLFYLFLDQYVIKH